jgi:hypothetical protein
LASLRDDQHGLPYAPDEMLVGASERIPRLTALIAQQPLTPQNAAEMHTTVMMAKFIDGVFETLNSNSHLALPYQTLHSSVKRGACYSSLLKNRTPDTVMTIDNWTLLIGEHRSPENLKMALNDLKVQVTNLSKTYHREVPYLLAYAASGSYVQFYIIGDGAQVSISEFDIKISAHQFSLDCMLPDTLAHSSILLISMFLPVLLYVCSMFIQFSG